jgi:hypothetical protein
MKFQYFVDFALNLYYNNVGVYENRGHERILLKIVKGDNYEDI